MEKNHFICITYIVAKYLKAKDTYVPKNTPKAIQTNSQAKLTIA